MDESFDRDRDSVQDTQTIAMLRNSQTGISPSSIDSSKFDEEKSPSSGQRSNDCDVMLDISMNSSNNEEIAKLIDGVPWSPLPDRSEPRKKALVSPAKHYVRRRSTELSYLASTLNVEENSKDKPEGVCFFVYHVNADLNFSFISVYFIFLSIENHFNPDF